MTKFINLGQLPEEQNKKKETVFTHLLESDKTMIAYETSPKAYDTVIFLGYDNNYGDVFKAYKEDCLNKFTILLGIKGDEFR